MKSFSFIFCFIMLFLVACKNNYNDGTEIVQLQRNENIDLKNKIKDAKTKIIFGKADLSIINEFLIANEVQPGGSKGLHLFSKNTFEYITSTGIIGKGPGEVAKQGRIGIDSKNKIIWVSDHGKKVMWKFPLDSVLNNEMYKPTEKIELNNELFIENYGFLNDSIVIGKAVRIHPNNSFDKVTAKLNLNTNITIPYGYEHPKAVGKLSNSQFKLSVKDSFYVNCYAFIDLMTICSLNGKLKYNVYGPGGMKNTDGKKSYYKGVDIIDKYIITSYNGSERLIYDEYKRLKGNSPSKFLIFNNNGNYLKTIETGYKFDYFCVDKENRRLIIYFNDRENPLGYIDLQEILN